ncbi:hypothetical protein [Shewanella gelidii]|uniref:DUF3192 domain-containing protein n=1 Tax=Shewanella gelidii TaxID=1642821 RepID=A0A917JR53_9GAMM|nr:hypothetical protein [Shewanella gelidii]MCL1098498.1 hypothetical protein [Shewanella gelidii]GGI82286.1 hypothetical protein GCM10009332_19380 [Shewanella gelidii]
MQKIRVGLSAILILVMSACSSVDEPELKEVMKTNQSNPLKVRDALIATFVKAPMPKIGAQQNDVKRSLSFNSALILQESDNLVVARFDTKGSQLEYLYEYCDLAYHFLSLEFTGGPYVIGDCSSVIIEGTKAD